MENPKSKSLKIFTNIFCLYCFFLFVTTLGDIARALEWIDDTHTTIQLIAQGVISLLEAAIWWFLRSSLDRKETLLRRCTEVIICVKILFLLMKIIPHDPTTIMYSMFIGLVGLVLAVAYITAGIRLIRRHEGKKHTLGLILLVGEVLIFTVMTVVGAIDVPVQAKVITNVVVSTAVSYAIALGIVAVVTENAKLGTENSETDQTA